MINNDMEGINMSLKPIDPKTLELNPFTTIGTEWMLLTAGNEDKHNTMTVSWGGLGVLWRKNVTYVLVRPQRYTLWTVKSTIHYVYSMKPISLH